MSSLAEITFQGFEPTEANKQFVAKHVSQFEKKFGRITSCLVIVTTPGHHHRNDGQYKVSIRLRLPAGKEVSVSKTPKDDERHADFHFAVADAFRRAQRQLVDKARQLQGYTKVHVEQPAGVVTQLFDDHGFISTGDGQEIYFHMNAVLNGDFRRLILGSKVSFAEEAGEKGAQASTVKAVKADMRRSNNA